MQRRIKAIIVDAELTAVFTLKNLLHQLYPEVEVLAVAKDVFAAKAKIDSLRFDVLFLDINMPKLNGFDLLSVIESKPFKVIFITADDQHAIKALQAGAIDYLLKPIRSDDLIRAISRLKFLMPKEELEPDEKSKTDDLQNRKRLFVRNHNKLLFIDFENIMYLKADLNYTEIYLKSGEVILNPKTIKYYQQLLPSGFFFRIHKSYIINANYIKEYKRKGTESIVTMSNSTQLNVSQLKQKAFKEFMINRDR